MHKEKIKRLLPSVFQQSIKSGDPLDAFLDVMELLHEPAEAILNNIDNYYNPYQTPDSFLPYLASWVDISQYFGDFSHELHDENERHQKQHHCPIPSGMGCLRELVSSASHLSRWRGTSRGLVALLETAIAIKGITIDEKIADDSGVLRPFYMEVLVPKSAEHYKLFLEKIIELEKPVYVTYRLIFTEQK